MQTIALFDQQDLGVPTPVGTLPWADRIEIRARDLIAERVILEWENRAAVDGERPQSALGVALTDSRDAVVARALEAFERGRFLLLADNRQIETLDEVIAFAPDATVTFLRLTPLRGG
ncbi:hypothetical protein [Caulobacter sp. Root1472]|uniref:hypothetical protein n=1 Tax=Caulobacter sp. Root1472 TaxID=1736470 RepID=UPI000700EDE1|nr:hypothetical protein [Caulobacter sp. Root1472]KQZ30954.1 hypothetical protein ASD47_17455 [Caulobacter sp. Root1472]